MRIKKATVARTAAAAVTVAILAAGLAACTVNTAPAASPPAPATASTPASHAPAPAAAPASHAPAKGSSAPAPASQAHDTSAESLPDYQPSKIVSKTSTSTTLSSPDSVTKIGAFYAGVLAKDGWRMISSAAGASHASFSVARGHQGASISVYPGFGGSGISISIYPR